MKSRRLSFRWMIATASAHTAQQHADRGCTQPCSRWIPATRVKWVAAQNASQTPPSPAAQAILFNRLQHVLTACRLKTAVRTDPGTDQLLICADSADKYRLRDALNSLQQTCHRLNRPSSVRQFSRPISSTTSGNRRLWPPNLFGESESNQIPVAGRTV